MTTRDELTEKLRGWFTGRLPQDLFEGAPEVTVDREEITVVGRIPEPAYAEGASEAEKAAALAGRIKEFRERTREARIADLRAAGHDWAGVAAELGGTPDGLRVKLTRALGRVTAELGLDDPHFALDIVEGQRADFTSGFFGAFDSEKGRDCHFDARDMR